MKRVLRAVLIGGAVLWPVITYDAAAAAVRTAKAPAAPRPAVAPASAVPAGSHVAAAAVRVPGPARLA